jgi:hypothetical protein
MPLWANTRPNWIGRCALSAQGEKMKKLSNFLVIFILPVVCGCVPLIIGAAAGGLGAYAVSKDTV